MTEPRRRPLRVLHLVGSEVSPFMADLSRLYAADCLRSTADPASYDVHLAYVTPGGRWRFPESLTERALAAATPMPFGRAAQVISGLGVDVALPQMFCRPGMTTYRSALDLLGLPFVGNTAEAMALTAHKARAKAVVAAAGVRVPAGQVLRQGERATLPLPVVVKPVDSDNSLGLSLVRRPEDLDAAVLDALAHSEQVLVEEYVELGREVRCGVLERDGELVALPLEEYAVDRDAKPIRDRDDKLRGSGDELALVAKDAEHAWIVADDDPVNQRVQDAARTCHRALGCRDYSLFDFRVDADGEPWFLEAGLYCSFAEQSVIAVMAAAAGVPLAELFATGLAQAVARSGRNP